jgi:hypothetical protein
VSLVSPLTRDFVGQAFPSFHLNNWDDRKLFKYPNSDLGSPDCLPPLIIPFAIGHHPAIASLQSESISRTEGPSVFILPKKFSDLDFGFVMLFHFSPV